MIINGQCTVKKTLMLTLLCERGCQSHITPCRSDTIFHHCFRLCDSVMAQHWLYLHKHLYSQNTLNMTKKKRFHVQKGT